MQNMFHLKLFIDFPFSFLISHLLLLWLENRLCITSMLLRLFCYVILPTIWSVLVNVSYEPGESLCFAVVGWNIL